MDEKGFGLYRPEEENDIGQGSLFELPHPFPSTQGSPDGREAQRQAPRAGEFRLTDLSPLASLLLDTDGLIAEVNTAAVDLLGATRSALQGAPFSAFVAPASRKAFLAHLERVPGRHRLTKTELDLGREPSFFRAGLASLPLFEGRRVVRIHSVVIDLSRLKHAEASLRESEERYRAFVEQVEDGIAITREEKLLFVNRRYVDLFGLKSTEAALAQPPDAVIHPDDRARVRAALEAGRKGEHAVLRYEFRALRPDGGIVHLQAYSSKMLFQGAPARLVHFHDVTAQRQAEDERKRLSLVVERATEMIVMTDAAGVVQYFNTAFARNTGWRTAELVGMHISECGAGEGRSFYEALWARLQKERKWSGRMTFRKDAGLLVQFDVAISPIRDSLGRIFNYVAVCRDVTTEAVLEQQLRQTQKMEAIGTLAGGIAHDFNNILAAIMGNAELALDDVPKDSSVYHNLEQIFRASRRGKDLVKQILAFSRRDRQDLMLVDIGPLVTETVKLLRSSIPATIDIRHDVEPGRNAVLGDAGRLQQVLMNLCANAAHAMKDKGGVLHVLAEVCRISESLEHLPELKPGSYCVIRVSDTGHGMSEAVKERIFDPFFNEEARRGNGHGSCRGPRHRQVAQRGDQRQQPGGTGLILYRLPSARVGRQRTDRRAREPGSSRRQGTYPLRGR
jgi:PAS domain S-box-containing protein